jgi:hypothetical protein
MDQAALVSETPKTRDGQYVSVVSGTPRIGLADFTELTGTGTREVSPPSVPPVSGQPASLQTLASEAEQAALKIGWQSPDAHAAASYQRT